MDISIIIPGYNTSRADWERCIASVKNAIVQACCSAEIICVDDGSFDGAIFLDERDDIVVVHQRNQGPSVARNAALAIAKGEWISFIDSDDVLHENTYKNAFQSIEKIECDVVVFGVETIWPSIKIKKDDVIPQVNMGELSPKNLKVLQEKNLLNYVWNKIYRRDFLVTNKIYFPVDAVMGEDLIFNLQCAVNCAKWSTIDYIGYTYYRTATTLLSQYKPKYVSGLLRTDQMWKMYSNFAQKFPGEALIPKTELTRKQLDNFEWRNMWMPNSPYSLYDKIKWLCAHPDVGGVKTFVKTFIYTLVRRYCYFNCVRKWHIKRLYPNAKVIK